MTHNSQPQLALQDTLDELETLIAEQQQDQSSDPGVIDLDDLLKESVASVEADRNLARSRKLLQRKDLPQDEREDLEARVAEWEARKYWETLAHVAVFHKQHCACGAVHQHFSHMMYHQQHRTDKFCQRWVRATPFVDTQTRQEVAALPNKVAFQNTVVPICHQCAAGAGFDLEAKDSLNWEIIQLAQEV